MPDWCQALDRRAECVWRGGRARRGGNEGPGQPLGASPASLLPRTVPGTQGLGRGVNATCACLLGRSPAAPPTSAACRSTYPRLPCPVGRGGRGVGWFRSEVTGRASVLTHTKAKLGWLVSSPESQKSRAVLTWPGMAQDIHGYCSDLCSLLF